jgi:L-ascorbate metabolism protein UlaG (beta-lactamase superfamily)
MKLTKYEHACFTLEKDGKVLVVDPGNFSADFTPPENVIGVVITHEHQDHLDRERVAAIIDKNPDALVIGDSSLVSQLPSFPLTAVQAGQRLTVGPFSLEFFGGQHAIIHDSIPAIANLGVMIDDQVYYPGDSFATPNKSVDVLALPVTAPWLKIGESIDFLTNVKPRLAFPTHDTIASDAGKSIIDRMMTGVANANGITYQRIDGSISI